MTAKLYGRSHLSEGAEGRLTLYDCWCTEQETKPEWLVTCLTPPGDQKMVS